MPPEFSLGKALLLGGLGLAALGAILLLFDKIGMPLGRLPGDIHVESGRSSFHFPIVTSLVVSVLATLLLNTLRR